MPFDEPFGRGSVDSTVVALVSKQIVMSIFESSERIELGGLGL
jgi:hypothetical protein